VNIAEFDYDLPPELVAQWPLPERAASRLLCLDGESGALEDRVFSDIGSKLRPDDVLVVNDTRVVKARLAGLKPTGGRVSILIERVLDERTALAQLRASTRMRAGAVIRLADGTDLRVNGGSGSLFEIALDGAGSFWDLMEAQGRVPLPPYVRRADEPIDAERYQTVYAAHPGAVAAPTAGLHFDEDLLRRLREAGVVVTPITLHIGAGTFQPVRSADLEAHRMHSERAMLGPATCRRIIEARARGGRVIAVGTTTVRVLESASRGDGVAPFEGETSLFIYPGFEFRCVDALITNFHLPRSTLLALVSAFAGRENVLEAYRHAVAERYRFYSYGDAMFITRSGGPRGGA
jgi:S-adenosylmethionine:tRNA ribosyltransferase-isomerase